MGKNVCATRVLSSCVLVVKPDERVVRPSLNVWDSLQIHLLLLAHFIFEIPSTPDVGVDTVQPSSLAACDGGVVAQG